MTTMGKYRHLSRCSTAAGHFLVLAIDHRTNLLDALNIQSPAPLTDDQFMAFKQRVLAASMDCLPAVLTDPAYGIGAAVASRVLSGRVGLLAPVEVTDYTLHPSRRGIDFIPGWSVDKIKRMGGDGVKLLLPYHPDADSAGEKHAVVRRLVDDCARADIPFFLEPIAYSLDPDRGLGDVDLRQITVDMAKTFSGMGVDVLKLQFPLNGGDEAKWTTACAEVNVACSVPWALLSGGVDFPTFMRQSRIACQAGASGVIVGRAVWNEAITLRSEALQQFLSVTVPARLRELADVCAAYASPWFTRVAPPDASLTWYEKY